MDDKTIAHFTILNNIIKDYEGNNKIALDKITSALMDSFSTYLSETRGYAENTAKRMIDRFKFLCARAEEVNFLQKQIQRQKRSNSEKNREIS